MKKCFAIVMSLVCMTIMVPSFAATKEQVKLNVTVRDFKADGILFEGNINSGEGLVQEKLGADKKPVYNLSKWQEMFGTVEWDEAIEENVVKGEGITAEKLNGFFNNVSGYNMNTKKTITLDADNEGYYIVDSAVDEMGEYSDGFFPIDNELFGNEDNEHNYHFSTEIHATFKYKTGDTFDFTGDDDVWVFFNNKLCVDLGGVHSEESESVSIDDLVSEGILDINPGDYVDFDMFYMERHLTGSNMYIKTNIDFVNFNNSDWATARLFDAYENELIPEKLEEENLTLPVYRDEFAAVAVKLYEKLTGNKAEPIVNNPFGDTTDPEVLKAFNLGIVKGMSDTKFAPRDLLSREQAAVMMTNTIKAAYPDTKIDITGVKAFADDKDISGWAKDSVYFMAKNKIIEGMGDNKFAPRNTTEEQIASKYANATREQALIISVKSLENLNR